MVDWRPSPAEPRDLLPANTRRHGRSRLAWAGAVLAAFALVGIVVVAVRGAAHIGSPFVQSLTGPVLRTPLDRSMALDGGEYTVYELTGHVSGGGGTTFTRNGSPTLVPAAVIVTGPQGQAVATTGPGSGTETVTRDRDLYTAAVRFTVPAPGSYRIVIAAREPRNVIITPSLFSGFSGLGGSVLAFAGSVATFLAGMVLLGVGLLGRSGHAASPRAPAPTPGWAPGQVTGQMTGQMGQVGQVRGLAPPGWYADPQAPQRMRYWDGRAWAPPSPPAVPPAGPGG